MNVVMTAAVVLWRSGDLEDSPFGWDEMEEMLLLAQRGFGLVAIQREVRPGGCGQYWRKEDWQGW